MGNLSTIRADIERDIRRNGAKAITGDILQARLLDIVGYLEDQEARKEYLTFEAAEDNVNVYFHDPDGNDNADLKVSVDGGVTWQLIHALQAGDTGRGNLVATLAHAGDKALLKTASDGSALGYFSDSEGEVMGPDLNVDGRCYVYGNVMSLLYEDFSNRNSVPAYALPCLFSDYFGNIDNTNLLSHPAKRLLLPATTLAGSCYSQDRSGCTGLTSAPELPATTLANYCYSYMFQNCTGLTSAPELPATTLAGSCYSHMFFGCTGLGRIKAMFLTQPGANYTKQWVVNVKSTGVFIKNSAATWEVAGDNGIPSGWTVQTASA